MRKFRCFWTFVILLSSLLPICGCKKKLEKKPPAAPSLMLDHTKDPVGIFCGADCANCSFNTTKCLTLLKENLSNLCGGPYKTNCYDLWLTYSKTCYALCAEKKTS